MPGFGSGGVYISVPRRKHTFVGADITTFEAFLATLDADDTHHILLDGIIEVSDSAPANPYLQIQKNVVIEAATAGSGFNFDNGFVYMGGYGSGWSVNVGSPNRGTSLTVDIRGKSNSFTIPAGFTVAVGDYVIISSDDVITNCAYDHGGLKPAEYHRIEAIEARTGIAYTSRPIENNMTVANNVKVFNTAQASGNRVELHGLSFYVATDSGGSIDVYAQQSAILGCSWEDRQCGPIRFLECGDAEISGCVWKQGTSFVNNYGITAGITNKLLVRDNIFNGFASHWFTTTGSQDGGTGGIGGEQFEWDGASGIVVENNTINVTVTENTEDGTPGTINCFNGCPLDTHAAGNEVVIRGNRITVVGRSGLAFPACIRSRSRNSIIQDNFIVGARSYDLSDTSIGIQVYGGGTKVIGNTITNVMHGISLDNYYQASLSQSGTLPHNVIEGNVFDNIGVSAISLKYTEKVHSVSINDNTFNRHSGNSYSGNPACWVDVDVTAGKIEQVYVHGNIMNNSAWDHKIFLSCVCSVSADTVTSTAHGLTDGSVVEIINNSSAMGGVTVNTPYYVVNSAANTFKLASTLGGTAINLTGSDWTSNIRALNKIGVTNICLASQDFGNGSYWLLDSSGTGASNPVVSANYTAAPDGTVTAEKITFDKGTAGTFSRIRQPITTSAVTYTMSVWMKTNDGTNKIVGLRFVSTGASYTVTPEWQRFSLSGTGTAGTSDFQVMLYDSLTTSDTANISIWGAQLVTGSSAQNYIPTTTASVTANQDIVNHATVDTDLSTDVVLVTGNQMYGFGWNEYGFGGSSAAALKNKYGRSNFSDYSNPVLATAALQSPAIYGTNTGDQNIFGTIAVSGQSNVVADATNDTLTLVAGSNVTITTDAGTDTITIAAAGGGGISDLDYGDIIVSGSNTVWIIDSDVVTNAKLANMATATIKGRTTAGTGDPEDLTAAQARTVMVVPSYANGNTGDLVVWGSSSQVTSWGNYSGVGGIIAFNDVGGVINARTITGTANEITVSNGAGTTANPTLSLPTNIDLSGKTSLKIPANATPTVTADGHVGIDTTVTDFSHGILKYYGGEELAVVAMPIAQLTSPADGYVVQYNATADEFQLAASGSSGLTHQQVVSRVFLIS